MRRTLVAIVVVITVFVAGGMCDTASAQWLDEIATFQRINTSCAPVIREPPQSVDVTVGDVVTLSVGAEDCVVGLPPTASRTAQGSGEDHFTFQTGYRAGLLLLECDLFTLPDSVRVYYEGQLIFDASSAGYGQFTVTYGPGDATSVEIVINEESGESQATAWQYTARYRPPQPTFQWRKGSVDLAYETGATLHFASVSLGDAGDYSVVVTGLNGSAVSAIATVVVQAVESTNCSVAPTDLVSWWSAEGNVADRAGLNHGVMSGGVSYATGKVGNAFAFSNRGEGVVKFDASPSLDVGTGDGFTVEGWIMREGNVPSEPIAEWNDGSRWGSHFWVLNDRLYANLTSPGGGWHLVISTTPVSVGVWHHVAMNYVKASGTVRLYLNGSVVTEEVIGEFSPETHFDLYLGRRPAPSDQLYSFEGLLDEFSLYRRALSSSEIAAIYRSGSNGKCVTNAPPSCVPPGLVAWWRGDGDAMDVTGAHNGELLYGTAFVPGVAGQAFTFDLSRARVSIPDSDAFKLTNSLSFEGWINVASLTSGIIFIRGDNRGGLDPYHMSIQPSGQLFWGINTAENSYTGLYSPGAVPTGVWTHVAAVLDGATGNMGLYMNGSLVNQTNTTLRPLRDLDPNSEPALGIGNHGGTFHHFPFHGAVDEWALYSRALSRAEIQGIFTAGAAGKCGTNAPPPLSIHDVSQDFSPSSNPAGAWSYGYSATLGGQFNLLTFAKTFGANNGVPISAWQVSDAFGPTVNRVMGPGVAISEGGAFTAPAGTVYVWPGNDGAPGSFGVIRFTVPTGGGGVYRLESAVRPTFDGPVSGDSDFHVLKNGQELFGRFLAPNSGTGYSNLVTLASGDSFDFVVGRGADGLPDHSSLKVQATLTLVTNAPPPSVLFDLSGNFSLASNPNGPWSYGHRTNLFGLGIQLLNTARRFGAENGVPIDIWQFNNKKPWVAKVIGPDTAVSTHFVGPPGTIYFGPEPAVSPEDFAVIRFTVPPGAGGTYQLETAVRSLYDSTRSVDADFHVVKNGQELFGAVVPPNSGTGYSNTLALAVGDRIDFIAGRGPNGLPETGLKIQATLKLVEQGFMGVDRVSFVAAGGIRVTGHAPSGTICHVERTLNLVDWEYAGTAVEITAGVYEFIDSQPPAGATCFYRMLSSKP